MNPKLLNLALENCNNPGLGDFILDGAPNGAYRTFAASAFSGDKIYYVANDGEKAEWGIGTLQTGSPNIIKRTQVIWNTQNNTNPLNFTSSLKIYSSLPADFVITSFDLADYISGTKGAQIDNTDQSDSQVVGIYMRPSKGRLVAMYLNRDGSYSYYEIAQFQTVSNLKKDLNNVINKYIQGTSDDPTDHKITNIYYRPGNLDFVTFEYEFQDENNQTQLGYISVKSHEWAEAKFATKDDFLNVLLKTGGEVSGDIIFSQNDKDAPWQVTPHATFRLNSLNLNHQIYAQLDGDKNPQTVISTDDRNGNSQFFLFKGNGALILPNNTSALGATTDRKMRMENLILSGREGTQVKFSRAFSSNEIYIYISIDASTIYNYENDSSIGHLQAGNAYPIDIDISGFTLKMRYSDGDGDNYGFGANRIFITAIGYD